MASIQGMKAEKKRMWSSNTATKPGEKSEWKIAIGYLKLGRGILGVINTEKYRLQKKVN